jgi:asparagine synthase (glutamine-hydrolysing)
VCGICGIAFADATRVADRRVLNSMRDTLIHRGPDDAGSYVAPGIALGVRRLKILDLSDRGHMPMSTADGRYWIAYNGEIYNYQELRSGLETRGYRFRSDADTEVLLNLFADRGPAMLDELNGMFAFGVWDTRERTLFLARDRLGVKPLLYWIGPDRFLFASEPKALWAAGCPAEFDPGRWEELLCFRFVAGEGTPYLGVHRLLPGHAILWRSGQLQRRRWWRLDSRARELRESPPSDPVAWFARTFDDAVRLRRISDVPVGVLLSGGLDSSSVAASAARQSRSSVASFTVRFDEPGFDEGRFARDVARLWNLDSHELKISGADVLPGLRHVSALNDEPLAHGSDFHLWAISEHARQFVTVLLSGEGADETMGGYVRYAPLHFPHALRACRPLVSFLGSVAGHGRLRKLGRFLQLGSMDDWVLYDACDVFPDDLRQIGMRPGAEFSYRRGILEEARSLYPGEPLRQAMYSDQHTFLVSLLDRNDRMTMGASIECRVPFLDFRLVEGLASLDSRRLIGTGLGRKRLLRRALGSRLPASVRRHRKWGFGVPWARYFRGVAEIRDLIARLSSLEPIRSGPFDVRRVHEMTRSYLAGNEEREALVRQLLFMVVWHEAALANSSTQVLAAVGSPE